MTRLWICASGCQCKRLDDHAWKADWWSADVLCRRLLKALRVALGSSWSTLRPSDGPWCGMQEVRRRCQAHWWRFASTKWGSAKSVCCMFWFFWCCWEGTLIIVQRLCVLLFWLHFPYRRARKNRHQRHNVLGQFFFEGFGKCLLQKLAFPSWFCGTSIESEWLRSAATDLRKRLKAYERNLSKCGWEMVWDRACCS